MLINLSPRRSADPQDLVDLLRACHARIRHFSALAYEAATRHDAPADQVKEACARVERYFREALPLHVADEEESIAPRLRGLSPEVDRALDTMEHQHEQHGPRLAVFLRMVAAVGRDPHALRFKDTLATIARDLERDFAEHLALEEAVIFPAIRELLSEKIQARIVDELRSDSGAYTRVQRNREERRAWCIDGADLSAPGTAFNPRANQLDVCGGQHWAIGAVR